jgi:hypothetical protein
MFSARDSDAAMYWSEFESDAERAKPQDVGEG